MYNFTDLIARSYLEYTKEDQDNIARFFFAEFCEVRPEANAKFMYTREHFFIKLIKKLDDFIRGAAHNHHIDRSYYDYDIEINEAEDFEDFEKNRLIKLQEIYDNTGYPAIPKRINYEECINAKDLKEALNYGLNLIDPVRIISVDKEIQANDLVLRKSKLEYLKAEAIRARDAENIYDLEISLTDKTNPSHSFTSENELKVRKAFEFTLKLGKNKKQILSNDDHLRLIKWVTFYFDNNYNSPQINTPISELNIGVTYIRFAFKLLIDQIYSSYPRPESFYSLVSICFKDLEGDTIKDIQRTSMPANWEKLNT